MTATWTTPIAQDIRLAVTETLGERALCVLTVCLPAGENPAADSITDITPGMPPPNFDTLPSARQACECVVATRLWARTRRESAQVLVLVPGEKEKVQMEVEWVEAPDSQNFRW